MLNDTTMKEIEIETENCKNFIDLYDDIICCYIQDKKFKIIFKKDGEVSNLESDIILDNKLFKYQDNRGDIDDDESKDIYIYKVVINFNFDEGLKCNLK